VHLRGAATSGSTNVVCTFPTSLNAGAVDMFLPDVVGSTVAPSELRIVDNQIAVLDAPGDIGSAADFTDLDGITFSTG
jgi:hypothetical protein